VFWAFAARRGPFLTSSALDRAFPAGGSSAARRVQLCSVNLVAAGLSTINDHQLAPPASNNPQKVRYLPADLSTTLRTTPSFRHPAEPGSSDAKPQPAINFTQHRY
jgi:hypothetical protein